MSLSPHPKPLTSSVDAAAVAPLPAPPLLLPRPPRRASRPHNSCVVFDEDCITHLLNEEIRSSAASTPIRRTATPSATSCPPHTTSRPTIRSQPRVVDLGRSLPPDLRPSQPRRHLHTNRKLKDWTLNAGCKYLTIGDSNLAHFPYYRDSDLQIDSYPGGNLLHAASLLTNATSSTDPEIIVLAFGLNHRSQKARATAGKQLQAALRAAKQRFPLARVIVPAINFSNSLPAQEQNNLNGLNKLNTKNCDYIDKLPNRLFDTDRDGIHWSRQTGVAMLKHWRDYLN